MAGDEMSDTQAPRPVALVTGAGGAIGRAAAAEQSQSASQVGQRAPFQASSAGMRFTGTVCWCGSHTDPVPPS
jgi:hypothetical protein